MEKLLESINALTKKSVAADKPNDAMQFAQAALNIAHTVATLLNSEALKK